MRQNPSRKQQTHRRMPSVTLLWQPIAPRPSACRLLGYCQAKESLWRQWQPLQSTRPQNETRHLQLCRPLAALQWPLLQFQDRCHRRPARRRCKWTLSGLCTFDSRGGRAVAAGALRAANTDWSRIRDGEPVSTYRHVPRCSIPLPIICRQPLRSQDVKEVRRSWKEGG